MKSELELRRLFKNNSDCYADTRTVNGGVIEEGRVIQAMTEDRFIKLLKELTQNQTSSSIITPSKQMDDFEFNLHTFRTHGEFQQDIWKQAESNLKEFEIDESQYDRDILAWNDRNERFGFKQLNEGDTFNAKLIGNKLFDLNVCQNKK